MFFRLASTVVFVLASVALAASLGGFGYLPAPEGFHWPSELGAPWAGLGMTIIFYGLAAWLWHLGGLEKPQTDFGRYAKAALVGHTIQIVGYAIILLALLFGPQIGNWILAAHQ